MTTSEEFEKLWQDYVTKISTGKSPKEYAYYFFTAGRESERKACIEAVKNSAYITGGGYYHWMHTAVRAIESRGEKGE